MMDLQAHLDGGDLAEAIAACVAAVKARPRDVSRSSLERSK